MLCVVIAHIVAMKDDCQLIGPDIAQLIYVSPFADRPRMKYSDCLNLSRLRTCLLHLDEV